MLRYNLFGVSQAGEISFDQRKKKTGLGAMKSTLIVTILALSGCGGSTETEKTPYIVQPPVKSAEEIVVESLVAKGIIPHQPTLEDYPLGSRMIRSEFASLSAKLNGLLLDKCTGDIFADVNHTIGDNCGSIEALANKNYIDASRIIFRPLSNTLGSEALDILIAQVDTRNYGVCNSLGINMAQDVTRGEIFRIMDCVIRVGG